MEKGKSKVFRSAKKSYKSTKKVLSQRELNKFNKTQRKLKKPLALIKKKHKSRSLAKSPFISMEIDPELEPGQLTLDFSFKGIIVSFAIFGHGGVKNEIPLETFKKPDNVKQTNILGMRFSGINNIGNRKYEEDIDTFLVTNKNEKTNEFIHRLDQTFLSYLSGHPDVYQRIQQLNQRSNIQNNYFGIKENYSSKNAQKIYTGASSIDITDHRRHRELTTRGPLVKIYSIIRNGREYLLPGQSIIIDTNIVNGITLTQIINIVIQSVLDSPIIPTLDRVNFSTGNNFIVNIVDLTCNSTDSYPLIEFIGKG
jgi:hypothetical protein